jgi:vacuolar-type H+-ATPase subunit E/Vma4
VVVKVREVDLDLARDCLSDATSQFKAKTGRDVTLTLDTVFLPPPAGANNKGESWYASSLQYCYYWLFLRLLSAGGVVLHSFGGRVVCDNTLDQRLALSFEQRLPEIRKVLFGASTTRRFLH